MSKETRQQSIGRNRRMGKELVNLRDKVGWMEEEDRTPLGSKAMVVRMGNCSEELRVLGEAEDWSNQNGRQTIGGDHSSHALWHVKSEGRQQGLQGGSSQKLDYVVEMEVTEDMLEVENLLHECG